MDKATQRRIRSLASDVKKEFHIMEGGQDMADIIRRLGGTLKKQDGIYSGSAVIKNGDGFELVLSTFPDRRRENFAAALELGHLFLHMGYRISEGLWTAWPDHAPYRSGGDIEKEYQAIEFAEAFLAQTA